MALTTKVNSLITVYEDSYNKLYNPISKILTRSYLIAASVADLVEEMTCWKLEPYLIQNWGIALI